MKDSCLIRRVFPAVAVSEMPYGVVMATGGAGAVADLCGLHETAMALTAIAIFQTILVPTRALLARGGVPVPRWRFGLFTIALGLAVIGGNVQPLAPAGGGVVLGMAWLATLVLGCWRAVLALRPRGLAETVDGTCFLAPAALLGDALAAAKVESAGPEWTVWLVVGACPAGVVG